jgi:hypothetical protein
MSKLQVWSAAEAEEILTRRFRFSQEARKAQEELWLEAERAAYAIDGGDPRFNNRITQDGTDNGGNVSFIGTNRINHHIRYKHSQLATNPPMVMPRPTSNDPEDQRKARIADKLAHFALRQYALQDTTDQVTLFTLTYGIGVGKRVWNPALGEIIDFDEESGEVTTDGDFEYTAINPWCIYPDPDAKTWDGSTGVKWVFEEILMDYNEACYMWPDKKDILESFRRKEEDSSTIDVSGREVSALKRPKFDVVRILQYWERGLPYNGLIGRFGWAATNGEKVTLLEPLQKNPHAFSPDGVKPGIAQLPYDVITDQDMLGNYWGMSDAMFAVKHQDARNMLDTAQLDILKAHGVARLVVFGGSEFNAQESITNSPLDVLVVDGPQKPDFVNPVPMPQGMISFTESLKRGEDEIFSINEAMMGQMSRETAGTAMQYATANGNAIRYRLFIKYTKYVERLYKDFFNVVKKNWTTSRAIKVVGKERAYEVIDIKGTDIDGGFDIVAEFGTSFSLDPIQRRQEILTMSPLLEKAGVSMKAQLKFMRMSEMDAMHDRLELGNTRQDEIFRKMVETGEYIAPKEYQDHASMLEYAQNYVMTAEFTYLPQDRQDLIVKHYNERLAMTGQQAAGAMGAGGPPPAGGPMEAMAAAAPQAAGAPPQAAPGLPQETNIMDLLTKG